MFYLQQVCCALAVAAMSHSAHAAFVNVTIENENAYFANHPIMNVRNAWNALGGTLDVYRVYANFTSNGPGDHVHRVIGTPATPSFLTSSSGEFWNYVSTDPKTGDPQHWDWPLPPGDYALTPPLAWDTTPAIGFASTYYFGGASGVDTVFNHFLGNWFNTSEAWTHSGNSTPGDAVAGGPYGYRVGLFQATVAAGVQIEGQFTVVAGEGTYWGANTYFTTVPGPGIPVMLATFVAVFIKPRHRRR